MHQIREGRPSGRPSFLLAALDTTAIAIPIVIVIVMIYCDIAMINVSIALSL
jgi:hypothetical protein